MATNPLRNLFGRFFDTAFGYAVGGAASAAIDPLVNPLVEEAWRTAVAVGDHRALNPADLANMVVQGVLDEADGAAEAAKSGMSADDFHRLYRVNGSPIAPDQALDLWDRGEISEADVDRALLQSRLKPEWVDTYKKLSRRILQADELANMVVQGILAQPDARAAAAKLGIEHADFDRMVLLAGNPPGPMEILEMWNRGILTEQDATLALRQSRLKPEWIEQFKQLRTNPASVSIAVEAVIKQRLPHAEGERIAAEHGIDAETFGLMVDAGGRPIATGQALTLFRRGEFTAADVTEAIARSNVRTDYAPDILKLATVLPSLIQVKQMLGTGAISDEIARGILHREGYEPDVVEGVIAAGHGTKLAGSKELTQAAILNGYASRQYDRATATELLQGLGYNADDVGILIGYADYTAAKRMRDAIIGVVKARYLQRDIDQSTASSMLDQAGVQPDERDHYLTLWEFDVQANPRLLTLAQLNAAVKAGILTVQQYRDYLPRLLYQKDEIEVLVQLYASG